MDPVMIRKDRDVYEDNAAVVHKTASCPSIAPPAKLVFGDRVSARAEACGYCFPHGAIFPNHTVKPSMASR